MEFTIVRHNKVNGEIKIQHINANTGPEALSKMKDLDDSEIATYVIEGILYESNGTEAITDGEPVFFSAKDKVEATSNSSTVESQETERLTTWG